MKRTGRVRIGLLSIGLLFATGAEAQKELLTTSAPANAPTAKPSGTVTQLNQGLGISLTPNPITTTGTIAIDTAVVPQLGTANAFTAGQSVSTGVGVNIAGLGSGTIRAAVSAEHTDSIASPGATIGVFGYASQMTNNPTYGAIGKTLSTTGTGVQGLATSSTGSTTGVYGQSSSSSNFAAGVVGYIPSSTGQGSGVLGRSDSTAGTGVTGFAFSSTGTTYGVYGQNASSSGTGVRGWAYSTSGTNYGVYGESDSASGFGVYSQGNAYVAGNLTATGVSTMPVTGLNVVVNASGQLGVATSSRRFKYEIENMNDATDKLLKLRPVTFRYKQGESDGSHPLQYGLIAEEVAEVLPELVQNSADGKPFTIRYQVLPAMLLNEFQKEHKQVVAQHEQIQALQDQIAQLTALTRQLQTEMTALKSQGEQGSKIAALTPR